MPYNDRLIKVDASQRELNDKIKNLITEIDGEIFWYIRFNLPLCESSVSSKTMKVTDTEGYIIKTEIIYNKSLELIIIKPIEKFEKEEYYILHITKKVKSEDKQNIKKNIHILFKIKEDNSLDIKELEDNVKVPRPKVDIRTNLNLKTSSTEYNNYQNIKLEEAKSYKNDKLPYLSINIKPLIAVIGSIIFLLGSVLKIYILIIVGIIIFFIGFFILILQMSTKEFKSKFFYNLGALRFNKGKYDKAINNFRKAIIYDQRNALADYSINICLSMLD